MSDKSRDIGRMTLASLDRDTAIVGTGLEYEDAKILVGSLIAGGAVGVAISWLVKIYLLVIPAALAGLGVGVLVLVIKPRFLTGTEYLNAIREHLQYSSYLVDSEEDDGQADVEDGDRVPSAVQDSDPLRERLPIERYHPSIGVIERDDGQLVGVAKIEAPTMEFATDGDWRHFGEELEGFAKKHLSFDLQVKVTKDDFPIEGHLDRLRMRTNHPDIDQSPGMEEVLREYVERKEETLDEEVSTTNYYFVLTASRDEDPDLVDEDVGISRLRQIPFIGDIVRLISDRREDVDEEDRLNEKLETLGEKLSIIQRSFAGEIEGAASSQLSTREVLALTRESLDGETHEPEEMQLRTQSIPDEQAITDDIDPLTEPELEEVHQRQLAPGGIERGWNMVQVDDMYRQTIHVDVMSDQIQWGAFQTLFTRPDLDFDFSLHLRPLVRDDAVKDAKKRYDSFSSSASVEGEELSTKDKLDAAERTELLRHGIDKEGHHPFEASIYVTVGGETKEEVREQSKKVRKVLKDAPCNMVPKRPKGLDQLRALESNLPLGKDVLDEEGKADPTSIVLDRGVGAMLESINKSSLLEEGGIELGQHQGEGTPIIKRQFDTESNYNWSVIADSGSGKTYFAAKTAIDTWLQRDDCQVIFIDPKKNFEGVAHAADAEIVPVGGGKTLNPLEIKPGGKYGEGNENPFTNKIKSVMSFFDNYAYQMGADRGLGEARPVLSTAVRQAYHDQGITEDPATHSKESPTISEVLDVLGEMADDAGEYIIRSEQEADEIEEYAVDLLKLLRPFETGEYRHLAGDSEFSLSDNDLIYLDVGEQGGMSGKADSLMMQLMFTEVYQAAKARNENTIIYVDEAQYFFKNGTNLEFISQAVRFARNDNTSIRFFTQEVSDFMDQPEAESIINNSAYTMFLRTDEIDRWADTFQLNPNEVNFIKKAATGDPGYSEALLDIDGDRYPLRITATPLKHQLIEFDPREDDYAALPGSGDGTRPIVRELLSTLDQEAARYRQDLSEDERAAFIDAWNSLPPETRAYAGLLTDEELYHLLGGIAGAEEEAPESVLADAIQRKIERLFGRGVMDTENIPVMFADEDRAPEEVVSSARPPELEADAGEADNGIADADDEETEDVAVGLRESSVIGEDDFGTTVLDEDDEDDEEAGDDTEGGSGTLAVPESRAEVFEQALAIDRRDISEGEKEEQILDLYQRAFVCDIEVEPTELRRAIELDRAAERRQLELTLAQLVEAVDEQLDIDELVDRVERDDMWEDLPEPDESAAEGDGATAIDPVHVENGDNGHKT